MYKVKMQLVDQKEPVIIDIDSLDDTGFIFDYEVLWFRTAEVDDTGRAYWQPLKFVDACVKMVDGEKKIIDKSGVAHTFLPDAIIKTLDILLS